NDLVANRGASIVITGDGQPDEVHELVAKINDQLGNVGSTIARNSTVAGISDAGPAITDRGYNQTESLGQLVSEMKTGAVELLIILGGNPVYDAPVDFDFASALTKVKMSVHHALHANETSRLCHWLVPASHFLESWSDATAFDGSISIVQPLIEPLYANISTHEMIGALI